MGYQTRKIAGPILPGAPYGFDFGVAQLRALQIARASPRERPERNEKLAIHCDLVLGFAAFGDGVLRVAGPGGCSRRGDAAQSLTRT